MHAASRARIFGSSSLSNPPTLDGGAKIKTVTYRNHRAALSCLGLRRVQCVVRLRCIEWIPFRWFSSLLGFPKAILYGSFSCHIQWLQAPAVLCLVFLCTLKARAIKYTMVVLLCFLYNKQDVGRASHENFLLQSRHGLSLRNTPSLTVQCRCLHRLAQDYLGLSIDHTGLQPSPANTGGLIKGPSSPRHKGVANYFCASSASAEYLHPTCLTYYQSLWIGQ